MIKEMSDKKLILNWPNLYLLVFPVIFFFTIFWLREASGPYWLHFNLDPTYSYFFNSLNLLNGMAPSHIDHPGTPVQFLGALIIKIASLGSGVDQITDTALRDPEKYIQLISNVIIFLNSLILFIIGIVAHKIFGNLISPTFLQLSPFLSTLILRHGTHFKPEIVLVFATLALILLSLYALKPGLFDKNQKKFVFCYGLIAGFGVATKIIFIPLLVLPILLFIKKSNFFLYALTIIFSFLFFTLPMIEVYDRFFQFVERLFWGSESYGAGAKTIIDYQNYLAYVYQLFMRPVLLIPFIFSLFTFSKFYFSESKNILSGENKTFFQILIGANCAQLFLILFVAKNPSGQYLIPGIILSGLTIMINFQIWHKTINQKLKTRLNFFAISLITIIIIEQSFSTYKSGEEVRELHTEAMKINNEEFSSCARIYHTWASSKSFALYWGDNSGGQSFASQLSGIIPKNDFWFTIHEVSEKEVRDFLLRIKKPGIRNSEGYIDHSKIEENYPCIYFRGTDRGQFFKNLPQFFSSEEIMISEKKFNQTCIGKDENVFTDFKTCERNKE